MSTINLSILLRRWIAKVVILVIVLEIKCLPPRVTALVTIMLTVPPRKILRRTDKTIAPLIHVS